MIPKFNIIHMSTATSENKYLLTLSQNQSSRWTIKRKKKKRVPSASQCPVPYKGTATRYIGKLQVDRHASGTIRVRRGHVDRCGLREALPRPVARVRGVVLVAVAPERIRLLPVDRVVSGHELLVGHPQWDKQIDEEADGWRGDDVPGDHKRSRHDLLQELDPAASPIERSPRARDWEDQVAQGWLGQESRQEPSQESRDRMGVEYP